MAYYTPIAVGESNDPSTVNTRLAQLSTAVAAIAASQVVDTGDVIDGLTGAVMLTSAMRYVDSAFVTDAADRRHPTLSAALAAASAGDTIMMARGTYSGDITLTQDRIKLIGVGPAHYNGSTLTGGTIITGTIDFDGHVGCEIRDLTVNVSGSAKDGIKSGTTSVGAYANTNIENVTVLGSGAGNGFHGILIQTGDYCNITNFRIYGFTHGLAIKSSWINVSNGFVEDTSASSIIVKSDATSDDVRYVNINNVILNGTALAPVGPINIQSSDDDYITEYVNVSNCIATYTDPAFIWLTRNAIVGSIQHINVTNCISINNTNDTNPSSAAFWNDGPNDVSFTNCRAINADPYSFQNTGDGLRITLNGCASDTPVTGDTNGPFDNRELAGKPNNAVHVYRTANQLIGNAAWTSLLWDAELFDETGMHSTSSNTSRLVALCAGTYEVAAMVRFDANATGNRFIRIDPSNASAGAEVSMANMGASTHTAVVTHGTYTLAAGDYVEIQCYQNSGGDLNALGAASQSHATMRKV